MQDAAEQRLQEELGISLPLTPIGKFYYCLDVGQGMKENEWDYLFIGFCPHTPENYNPEEVQDLKWVVIDDLASNIEKNPSHYSAWLPLAWQHTQNLCKQQLQEKTKQGLLP